MIRAGPLRLAVGVSFGLALPALAQTPEPDLPVAKIAAVEAVLKSAMARHGIPGLSLALVVDSKLVWSAGMGIADVENDVPAKPETVYRLASLSKPITAVAVLQLVERGKLDLDAPVQRYVPSFPEKAWPVTTRQLLGHVAGIRHFEDGEIKITRHYTSLGDALALFKDDPLVLEPGTRFLYTTHGYTLVGCVIEGAAEAKYVDYVRENVFAPAEIETAQADDLFGIIKNRARGYQRVGGALHNAGLTDTSYKIPGGGLCASAPDMGRFAMAPLDGALLKKETVAEMFRSVKTRGGTSMGYGLGFALDNDKKRGRREVFHTGGQQGFSNILYILPERRFAVAILTNLENVQERLELARQVADAVLR